MPGDERLVVERHLREFDRLGEDLKVIERDLARSALADEGVKRLMTIPGVDMIVALAIVATIGEVGRFEQSQKLVSYLGRNPSVRQSGPGPAYHGQITKQGPGHARGMLVEAAWASARAPLVHSRRRPKHFQPPAPSHMPPHAPRLPRRSFPDVASCDSRMNSNWVVLTSRGQFKFT